MKCPTGKSSGKECHATYAEALAALMRLKNGHIYDCDTCGQLHVSSSTALTRHKSRGRGKRRRAVA